MTYLMACYVQPKILVHDQYNNYLCILRVQSFGVTFKYYLCIVTTLFLSFQLHIKFHSEVNSINHF